MSKSAKIFISFTIAAGLAVVLQSLLQARLFPHGPSYFWFCGAGILSSLLKVRLPRVTGTVSANFLVILVATAMFSLSETVIARGRLMPGAVHVANTPTTGHSTSLVQHCDIGP
jgi:hypothetical protein